MTRGLTVVAIGVAVFASATMLHELGHAVAGALAGGNPTLVSSTDLRGEWSQLSTSGFLALGLSGSLVNWLLAFAGLLLAAVFRGAGGTTRFALWLLVAANGLIASVYMVTSPLLGFGDWMTMLRRLPSPLLWRVGVAAMGVALTLLVVRWASSHLEELLEGERAESFPGLSPLRAVRAVWLAGGGIAVLAALLSPLGLAWAVGIALGSSMGTTWPLLPVARHLETKHGRCRLPIEPSWPWVVTGVVVGGIFVLGFGPGIPLEG